MTRVCGSVWPLAGYSATQVDASGAMVRSVLDVEGPGVVTWHRRAFRTDGTIEVWAERWEASEACFVRTVTGAVGLSPERFCPEAQPTG